MRHANEWTQGFVYGVISGFVLCCLTIIFVKQARGHTQPEADALHHSNVWLQPEFPIHMSIEVTETNGIVNVTLFKLFKDQVDGRHSSRIGNKVKITAIASKHGWKHMVKK